MKKNVTGKIKHSDLETGSWLLVDQKNVSWRLTNIPEKLKKENLYVKLLIEEIDDEVSIFMQGTPAKIIDHTIL